MPQKRKGEGLTSPQEGQTCARTAPHALQKLCVGALSWPHWAQVTTPPKVHLRCGGSPILVTTIGLENTSAQPRFRPRASGAFKAWLGVRATYSTRRPRPPHRGTATRGMSAWRSTGEWVRRLSRPTMVYSRRRTPAVCRKRPGGCRGRRGLPGRRRRAAQVAPARTGSIAGPGAWHRGAAESLARCVASSARRTCCILEHVLSLCSSADSSREWISGHDACRRLGRRGHGRKRRR